LNREVRDQIRDLQSRINALSGGGGGSLFPTGAIVAWTGQNVPNGWLLCDGRTVPKGDYLSLSNEIGVAYNPGGIDLGLVFQLPRLNDALPRGAAGSVNGLIDARGEGAGANSTSLSHPANVSTFTGNTSTESSSHTHDSVTIHAGGAHTDGHTHTINQNTGGHNHNMDHNHNLSVDNVAVNRNTGATIVAVGHNHSCVAVGVGTTSDGAHNHSFNQGQSSTISAPSGDSASWTGQIFDAANSVFTHQHDYGHTHAWTGTHTLGLVPSSLSVNYIIKT
jgi:microcystin-dependent protein